MITARVKEPEKVQATVEKVKVNPGGGSFVETDPTVPDWAKQPEKPKYTAKEVGALAQEDKEKIVQEVLAAIPVGDEVAY